MPAGLLEPELEKCYVEGILHKWDWEEGGVANWSKAYDFKYCLRRVPGERQWCLLHPLTTDPVTWSIKGQWSWRSPEMTPESNCHVNPCSINGHMGMLQEQQHMQYSSKFFTMVMLSISKTVHPSSASESSSSFNWHCILLNSQIPSRIEMSQRCSLWFKST